MKHVRILDTTLRDGGRVVDCAFPDEHIKGIVQGLVDAGIDIVELGFLRGDTKYSGGSTIFTEMEQIKSFIPEDKKNTEFVVFGDYGKEFKMWDYSKLTPCDGTSVVGFRIGYRKKDLANAIELFNIVKENGYRLYIQGVESMSYTDEEMIAAIKVINRVHPYSFGIVDTYGAMYKDDVLRYYKLVDEHLSPDIAIDFHSHNNFQLSFSFAQEIIEVSKGHRNIVVDATLEGISKGAGNLNTELLVDYLNRKMNYSYDFNAILDTIDDYIYPIKQKYDWSYQIPYVMAGIYSSHANNIIYLTNKHRIKTKDIKHILEMIEPETRKRYNYDYIEQKYIEYNSLNCDDSATLKSLRDALKESEVLVVVPGSSLLTYAHKVNDYIREHHPVVISVNFIYDDKLTNYVFWGNQRRYTPGSGIPAIITSNVKSDNQSDLMVNYNKLINRGYQHFDNSTIMLLNLLKNIGVERVSIAGFDGYDETASNNFYSTEYVDFLTIEEWKKQSEELETILTVFSKVTHEKMTVNFLTPSRFEAAFSEADS